MLLDYSFNHLFHNVIKHYYVLLSNLRLDQDNKNCLSSKINQPKFISLSC